MEPIFLLIASFFVLSIVLNGVKRKKQQEEMRRKRAEYELRNAAKDTSDVQAQAPTAVRTEPVKPVAPTIRTEKPNIASQHLITVMEGPTPKREKPSAKAAEAAYEMHRSPSKQTTIPNKDTVAPVLQPFLQWDRNSAVQGIVYAEILGKPKALRRK